MADFATFADIQNISNKEAQRSQRTILGITIEPPKYEMIPPDNTDGVREFVVDCWLLESASQVVVLGSAGLRVLKNVIVSSEATGDLLADIHVPVDIRRNSTGQLEIVGRAKVALPTLRLDEYNPGELGIHHILELDYDEDEEVWRDAFGIITNIETGLSGSSTTSPTVNATSVAVTNLTNLGQLAQDEYGNPVLLGVNPLQRVTISTESEYEVRVQEIQTTIEERELI
jgi:hypothetical protein